MTLTEAQTMLDAAKSAYTDALAGKAVSYNDRAVTRQDIKMLSEEIDKWTRIVDSLTRRAQGQTAGNIRIAKWS